MSDRDLDIASAPASPAPPHEPPARARRWRRWLLGGPAKALLSIALVAWLAAGVDWPAVGRTLRNADPRLVAAALVPLALVLLVASERWRNAALACAVERPRRFFVRATWASQFAGQFLPAAVGADAVRLALLWRDEVPLRGSFLCVVVDRLCGIAAIAAVMAAGLPFALPLLPAGAANAVAVAVPLAAVVALFALFVDRLPLPGVARRGWAGRFLALAADARRSLASPRTAWAFALSLLLHVLSIGAVLVLARAFGYALPPARAVSAIAFAIFAAMLPISFNGWGVREGAMVLGLALVGVPRDVALMVSLLYGLGQAVAALPGSVLWFRLRPSLARAAAPTPPA